MCAISLGTLITKEGKPRTTDVFSVGITWRPCFIKQYWMRWGWENIKINLGLVPLERKIKFLLCLKAGQKSDWTTSCVENEESLTLPSHSPLAFSERFSLHSSPSVCALGLKKLQSDKSIMKWKPRLQPVCLIV